MEENNPKPVSEGDTKVPVSTPAAQPAAQQPSPAQPSSPNSEDPVFYNVMPQQAKQGSLISPQIKISNSKQSLANSGPKPPYLKYGLFALGLLALAAAAYFIVQKFTTVEEEPLVINTNANRGNIKQEPTKTPQDWQEKYFAAPLCEDLGKCGDDADPDLDGLHNIEEYDSGTDPNNKDSDKDGLADGDEFHVFSSNPMNAHSANDSKYNDADFLKGAYDLKNPSQKLTTQQIADITARMREYGLHQPTLTTLDSVLNAVYKFSASTEEQKPTTASSTPASSTETRDNSPEAKQDRDSQRYNTMKTVSISLVKYYEDKKAYPEATTAKELLDALKPYNKVATNFTDPINEAPYFYSYTRDASGIDFTLTYYSETQNQLIRLKAKDGQKFRTEEESAQFDGRRKSDLDSLRTALLLYSANNINEETQLYTFPTKDKYKTAIVPQYIGSVPKDPQTGADYEYEVGENFDTFTLKAKLSNPEAGKTGWMCNEEDCMSY